MYIFSGIVYTHTAYRPDAYIYIHPFVTRRGFLSSRCYFKEGYRLHLPLRNVRPICIRAAYVHGRIYAVFYVIIYYKGIPTACVCARASLFCPRPSIRQQFCVYCIHKRPTFSRAVASYGQYIHTRTYMRYSRWSFYYYSSAYIYRFSLALLLLLYDDVVVRGGDKGETENLTDLGFYVYHEGLYRYVFFFFLYALYYTIPTYVISRLIFSTALYTFITCVVFAYNIYFIRIRCI